MKRKKDRSGKVALIASLVVISLVGICVFSLYSIKEPGFLKGIGLFFGANGGTATGKHLTREDGGEPAAGDNVVVVTGTVGDEDDGYAAPVYWETEDGQAVVVLGQQATPEEEQLKAAIKEQQETSKEEKKDTSQEEQKETPAQEQKDAAPQEEQKDAPAEEQKDTAPQEQKDTPALEVKTLEADLGKDVQDVSGTALNGTADQPEAVAQDVYTDTDQVTDTALMAVDDTAETYEAPVHQIVRDDTAETAGDDGWRFNYETEEWYREDSVYEQAAPIQQTAYYGAVQDETGEWRFNEETEEWYYAEFADDSVDDEADEDADKSDETDTDESAEETGEWRFNEDTGEWYYALIEPSPSLRSTAKRTMAVTAAPEDESEDQESGEWLFNEDTGEWYYAESTGAADGEEDSDDQDDESQDEDSEDDSDTSTGAWLFNEETGEWYYEEAASAGGDEEDADAQDEDADDTDDSDDTDTDEEDDETVVEGEWIYDEETQEWVYVEGVADKEDKKEDEKADEKEAGAEDAAVEETIEERSLGEEIVDYAMDYVGVTPYVWAGNSLTGGTDCSGFVHLIYDKYGVYCSHASMSYDGTEFGEVIGLDELQPGDIVVYGGGAHVAIYAGDGYVVHCSSPENGTVYWKMDYRSDASWGLRVLK